VRALREIRHYQKTHGLLIPISRFTKLVREVTHCLALEYGFDDFRFKADAICAVQEGAEMFLVDCFHCKYSWY
jgi:histone H3/H4